MPIVYALGVLGVLGAVFGALLTMAGKVFYVETDPRADQILEVLAGANCGACGYPGCDAYSKAVAAGQAPVNKCTPGGASTTAAVAEIMGVAADTGVPQTVQVLCQGFDGCAAERYKYEGLSSCELAAQMAGGPKDCMFSCMGLGDCVKACAFDAMTIEKGVAHVNYDHCVACGCCITACPRDIIIWAPKTAQVHVRCKNHDLPKPARTGCTMACIGCKRCEKACEHDAIHVTNNLAAIDYDKCTACGACVEVCPDKCITMHQPA